ncbi:MAG: 50S ribosomal protein L4 [Candidatus Saganbacteria bacterium]|nr:50S ribosomal protein L4 [Candidatus Saganbacteria bacterium]
MATLPVYNLSGKSEGTLDVREDVFGVPPNSHVVHSTLVWYLASKRSGLACAKGRGEVSGGGVKPWKQKGTGRARAGDNRSPLWRKGGVVFGPKPRDYSFALPIKVRKLALRVVLSDRAREGKIKVVPELILPAAKTKEMVKILKNLKISGKGMIILGKPDEKTEKAARNINGVKIVEGKNINIHELLGSSWILLERDAAVALEVRLGA